MEKQDREKLTEFINQNKQRVNIYGSGREKEYEVVRVDSLISFIEQPDPPEKVKLPKLAADWLEACKKYGSITDLLDGTLGINDEPEETLIAWLNDNENSEVLARAWLDGYEVIKPSYRVSLPIMNWDDDEAELKEEAVYLGFDITSDETTFIHSDAKSSRYRTKLTEEEIKGIDERYWKFAVPVEASEVGE